MTEKTYDVVRSQYGRDAVIIATESNTGLYIKQMQIAQGLTMDEAWAITKLINSGEQS